MAFYPRLSEPRQTAKGKSEAFVPQRLGPFAVCWEKSPRPAALGERKAAPCWWRESPRGLFKPPRTPHLKSFCAVAYGTEQHFPALCAQRGHACPCKAGAPSGWRGFLPWVVSGQVEGRRRAPSMGLFLETFLCKFAESPALRWLPLLGKL